MKSHWTHTPLLLTAALLASCFLTAWMAVHGFYINTCADAGHCLGCLPVYATHVPPHGAVCAIGALLRVSRSLRQ